MRSICNASVFIASAATRTIEVVLLMPDSSVLISVGVLIRPFEDLVVLHQDLQVRDVCIPARIRVYIGAQNFFLFRLQSSTSACTC